MNILHRSELPIKAEYLDDLLEHYVTFDTNFELRRAVDELLGASLSFAVCDLYVLRTTKAGVTTLKVAEDYRSERAEVPDPLDEPEGWDGSQPLT
ncbi:MAG: hypothetical protein ACNA8R_15680 [Nitriliruptoraceae bacterium]